MDENDPAHRALDEAIRLYVAAVSPGSIVTEWILPIVSIEPDYASGEVMHSYASSSLTLHSRVGILTYQLRNAEQDMIQNGRDNDDD